MTKQANELYEFGPFRVDPREHLLLRDGEALALTPKAFETLLVLIQNNGHLMLKDELMKALWPDSFVEEVNLSQNISVLRRVLGDTAQASRYIVTVPGKGYRFVGEVRTLTSEVVVSEVVTSEFVAPEVLAPEDLASEDQEDLVLESRSRSLIVIEEQVAAPVKALPPRSRHMARAMVLIALMVLAAAAAVFFYIRRVPKLTAKDTIVLADFDNNTADPVFDDTLKTALSVALGQSPFLHALSESRVAAALQRMTRPPGTKLTPEVAREVCQRAGSKAYIAGSIARLGSQYVLALEAVNCQNGDTLVQEQVTASAKEKVLNALGEAAAKLRGVLGESLATVRKFDVPLAEATTPSLEALKAYSLAYKALFNGDSAAALPYSQHAIELDPNFAMAFLQLGVAYLNLSEPGRASECYAKAFTLRERTSEWEKLIIEANYYAYATGELDKARQTFQEEIEIYPRNMKAYDGLASVYQQMGEYEKSAEASRALVQVDPDDAPAYAHLALAKLNLQRFDEARQIVHEAQARKLDGSTIYMVLYVLAFLGADSSGMAEQQRWFAGQPAYKDYGLALASDTEAYAGHGRKARELTRQAVDAAIRADNKEGGGVYRANAVLQEAAYGNALQAQRSASEALKLVPDSPGVAAEAALALAMTGGTARAESLAQGLGKRFPLDTQMQSLWLPAIQAQLALNRRNPGLAVNTLQAASSIELGNISFANSTSCLYPTYVRGEAYLAAGQGTAAAVEFQKILDHSGIVWNCWTGALAHLGVARANALQARNSQGADADAARGRALAAYKDFLSLWNDGDPDIPVLKEAKAEYAKIH